MPDARSEVQIVISGTAVGLEEALKQAQAGLSAFSGAADKAGAQAGGPLAAGEHKAAHEALGLGERAKVAAEMVGLLGAESSEQVLKIDGLNRAFREAQHAFGGFGGALAAMTGSFALFGGLDFMKESVSEAMKGEEAWARLSAAYAGNASALKEVKEQIEGASASWAALGLNQSQVADLAARARAHGLDTKAILGDPQALADTAAVLKSPDLQSALDAIGKPRGAQQVLLGLGGPWTTARVRAQIANMQGWSAAQRATFLQAQVEASHFKGMGTAFEQTDAGKLLKFHKMMENLQEEVGTALLPAILQLVEGMTSLLQSAERITQPFGGLANVLKTLFVPMLGLGLLLFTNLRGVMTRLVDVLLGRLVGAFAQTASSMAEADAGARTLATDIEAIPELAPTKALFTPDPAKERWIANVLSVPKEAPTRAIFTPAAIMDAAAGTVAVGTAIAVPTAAEAAAAVAEAETLVRAQPAVRIPSMLAMPQVAEVSREARTINALLSHALRAPVHLQMPAAAQISAQARKINALMSHALTATTKVDVEAVNATVVDHVNDRLGGILSRARGTLAGTHLFANVGAAVTFTAGMEVANAIFNGAKFNQPDLGHLPQKVTFSAADQARLDALTKKLNQPQHVHVDGGTITANLGTLPGALVVNASLTGDDKSVLKGQIAALDAQKKAAEAYTRALADAQKHPIPVQVHFDAKEMAKMVGEIALGTLIANILTKVLDPGKIFGFIKGGGLKIGDFLSGKGLGTTAAAAGEASPEAGAINALMGKSGLSTEDALSAAAKYFKGGGGGGSAAGVAEDIAKGIASDMGAAMETVAPIVEGAVGLKVGGALLGGLGEVAPMVATAAVDIGALVFSGIAEGVTAGLATPLVAALLGGLGVVTLGVFTHGFGLMGKDGKKEAEKLRGAFNLGDVMKNVGGAVGGTLKGVGGMLGGIGAAIIKGIASGVTGALRSIEDIGAAIMTALAQAIMKHWPGVLPWIFGGERPKSGDAYLGGKNYPYHVRNTGQAAPHAPSGYEYDLRSSGRDVGKWFDLMQKTAQGPRPAPAGTFAAGGAGGLSLASAALVAQLGTIIANTGRIVSSARGTVGTGAAPALGQPLPAGGLSPNVQTPWGTAQAPSSVSKQAWTAAGGNAQLFSLMQAVMARESGFNAGAIQQGVPEGERGYGIAQFTATLGAAGLKKYLGSERPAAWHKAALDPQAAIKGLAAYLTDLLKEAHGNAQLALAMYNAGPGASAESAYAQQAYSAARGVQQALRLSPQPRTHPAPALHAVAVQSAHHVAAPVGAAHVASVLAPHLAAHVAPHLAPHALAHSVHAAFAHATVPAAHGPLLAAHTHGAFAPVHGALAQAHGALQQVAAHLRTLAPSHAGAAHHAAPAHPASAHPAAAPSHATYNATFHINGATDANAVARQVNHAFAEFTQGLRSSKRLHG